MSIEEETTDKETEKLVEVDGIKEKRKTKKEIGSTDEETRRKKIDKTRESRELDQTEEKEEEEDEDKQSATSSS